MFEDLAAFICLPHSLNRPKSLDSIVEFSCFLLFKGDNAGWFQQSLHYSDLEQFSHIPLLSVMYPCIVPTLTLSARVWKGKHHLGMCHLFIYVQDTVDPPVCTYV